MYQLVPDLPVTVEDILAEGDNVMVRNVWRGNNDRTGQNILNRMRLMAGPPVRFDRNYKLNFSSKCSHVRRRE